MVADDVASWLIMWRLNIVSLVFGIGLGMSFMAHAEPRHYVVDVQVLPPVNGGDYYINLLSLILNASKAPDEVIDFNFADKQLAQARWVAEVQKNEGNNVLWTVTSKDREEVLRPIRVSIFRDLLSYRLLVIRKADQAKFAAIKTKNDLAQLMAGQGAHWPDTDVLLENQLPVMVGMAKENLYKMLSAKRFDYFPRAITEVFIEEQLMKENDAMVEPHLILYYPNVMYFFVSKQNEELARRIEAGWDVILKNGEFDKLYVNVPRVKAALAELKEHKRTMIALDNPFLSDISLLK